MSASQIAIVPPRPVSPLNYTPFKGQLRQVADGSWVTWDGRDWAPTVIPPDQLAAPAGMVTLSSGLIVPSLTVNGDATVSGTVHSDDVEIKSTRSLSDYGSGYDYESRNVSAGAMTTSLAYLGVGITWTYDAKERLKFTYRAEFESTAITQSNQAEWRLNLFGSSAYTGSVNTNDQNYDTVVVPAPYNSGGRMTLNGFFHMPPGYWPNGAVVYLALSGQLLFAGNDVSGSAIGWYRNGAGLSSWPATLLKEVIGYAP